ncbi:ParB/RepB/Spo0J family partition protein [Fundidesulfovibrio terrae]|uniref:ParB/RepB/Spo0J family partition protein n=1 Tax=Fundidesulfovibrio terrae TaxID=2922866 RepID=UPI001FAED752|nr:ParB/Srx family N-terminal domain-containing protein [Fundidesulfovibrio terrae]
MNATGFCLSDVEKVSVKIEDLFLDVRNPRFHGETDLELIETDDIFDLRNQEIIRQYILKKYAASEIVDSILEVGFVPVDLVVVEAVGDKYIVVEGNRRVTAIKTIHGNIQRKDVLANDDVLRSITEFEVLKISSNKGDADLKKWILQGIRHVSGVRQWGPYQQAMLIHELYYRHGLKFKDIGKTIGVHFNRVSTMLRAYLAILQMKQFDEYKEFAHANLFSHFEQAYIKKSIRDWMEWNDELHEYTNKENLLKFYDLIIGKNKKQPVMSRNVRDDLPLIYENKDVFEDVMNSKITVDEARKKIIKTGNSLMITELLMKCLDSVKAAAKSGALKNEHLEIISKIQEVTSI